MGKKNHPFGLKWITRRPQGGRNCPTENFKGSPLGVTTSPCVVISSTFGVADIEGVVFMN